MLQIANEVEDSRKNSNTKPKRPAVRMGFRFYEEFNSFPPYSTLICYIAHIVSGVRQSGFVYTVDDNTTSICLKNKLPEMVAFKF